MGIGRARHKFPYLMWPTESKVPHYMTSSTSVYVLGTFMYLDVRHKPPKILSLLLTTHLSFRWCCWGLLSVCKTFRYVLRVIFSKIKQNWFRVSYPTGPPTTGPSIKLIILFYKYLWLMSCTLLSSRYV